MIELCTQAGSAASIAEQSGASRTSLYKWKRRLLDEKDVRRMDRFRNRSWKDVSLDEFISELDAYLRWYNEERIKVSLRSMSPAAYRNSLGFAA